MIRSSSSRSWSNRLRRFVVATLTIILIMLPVPPVYAQSIVSGIVTTSSEVTHELNQRARAFLKDGRFSRLLRSPQITGQNRGMPAGQNTRIGQNGNPLRGNPALSARQRQVVQNNQRAIRNAVKQMMKEHRFNLF